MIFSSYTFKGKFCDSSRRIYELSFCCNNSEMSRILICHFHSCVQLICDQSISESPNQNVSGIIVSAFNQVNYKFCLAGSTGC